MGSGIAQTLALAGLRVNLYDLNQEATSRAKATIEKSLNKLSSRGKISEEAAGSALDRIHPTTDLDCTGEADVVIENFR